MGEGLLMDKEMMWVRLQGEESKQIPILEFLGPMAVTLTPEDREARLAVCEKCPSQAHGQCLEDGEYVPVTSWDTLRDCPLGKWDKSPKETVLNPDQQAFEDFFEEKLRDAGE